MVFCRACGKQIHETAVTCPQCGALQNTQTAERDRNEKGTLWIPIPALVCGIIATVSLFDDSDWDRDAYTGLFITSAVAIALGIAGVATQNKGRGMSIAAIVLGVLGTLGLIGSIFG